MSEFRQGNVHHPRNNQILFNHISASISPIQFSYLWRPRIRSSIQIDPNKEILLDVSSTSDSDTEYITPLTGLRKEELKEKEREMKQRAIQSKLMAMAMKKEDKVKTKKLKKKKER